MDEDFISQLKTFEYYKQLILRGMSNGWNIIIETKDHEFKIVPNSWLSDKWNNNWEGIERMTVFFKSSKSRYSKVEWKEYEFVSTV